MSLRNPQARFVLDHKAGKVECPACGKRRTFRMYIDRQSNEHLPQHVGVCDREHNCGYRYTAAEWIRSGGTPSDTVIKKLPPPKMKDTSWRCPEEWVRITHASHALNKFAHWLARSVGKDKAREAFRMYRIGTLPLMHTYPHWAGACVFWQIGMDGKERSGKLIPYGEDGRRLKDMGSAWIHTMVTGKGFEDIGCGQVLFGEHLLKERPADQVCIVESEKTAVVCSTFWPEHVWLATGGSNNLSVDKCLALAGAKVHVFPDKGATHDWRVKCFDIEVMCERLTVHDDLEHMPDVEKGADIADLLLPVNRLENVRIFEPEEVKDEAPPVVVEPVEQTSLPPIVNRMIAHNPSVRTLLNELDIDTDNLTIKTLA